MVLWAMLINYVAFVFCCWLFNYPSCSGSRQQLATKPPAQSWPGDRLGGDGEIRWVLSEVGRSWVAFDPGRGGASLCPTWTKEGAAVVHSEYQGFHHSPLQKVTISWMIAQSHFLYKAKLLPSQSKSLITMIHDISRLQKLLQAHNNRMIVIKFWQVVRMTASCVERRCGSGCPGRTHWLKPTCIALRARSILVCLLPSLVKVVFCHILPLELFSP